MKQQRSGQGRSKKQIEINEKLATASMFLFVVFFALFVIINALANG